MDRVMMMASGSIPQIAVTWEAWLWAFMQEEKGAGGWEQGPTGQIPSSMRPLPQKLGDWIRIGLCEFPATVPPWLARAKPEIQMNRALNVFLFDTHA